MGVMTCALRMAGLAVAVAVVGTGCAADKWRAVQPAQPFHAADQPQHGTTEQLSVRGAFVLGPPPSAEPYPPGSDAALYFSVVNPTGETDYLVDASTPAAASTVVSSPGTDRIVIPPSDPSAGDRDHVDVGRPPYSPYTVTLTALERPLRIGDIVPVTLTFSNAGVLTVDVPVTPRDGFLATLSPAP